MTAEAIIERDVIVPAVTDASRTPFSWSAAIAGTLAAMAVAFIIMALGSGIGLSFASPYGSGPSATSLTVAAAVWLVMAQTMGFATGGYLAGRLRSPAYDGVIGETTFRDAAQGFIVWALGAVAMAAFVGLMGYLAASAATQAAAGAATGVGVAAHNEPASTPAAATDYFVDLLFRPGPAPTTASTPRPSDTVGLAAAGAQPGLNAETRAEVTRIVSSEARQSFSRGGASVSSRCDSATVRQGRARATVSEPTWQCKGTLHLRDAGLTPARPNLGGDEDALGVRRARQQVAYHGLGATIHGASCRIPCPRHHGACGPRQPAL